jgi:hypothetical protein
LGQIVRADGKKSASKRSIAMAAAGTSTIMPSGGRRWGRPSADNEATASSRSAREADRAAARLREREARWLALQDALTVEQDAMRLGPQPRIRLY